MERAYQTRTPYVQRTLGSITAQDSKVSVYCSVIGSGEGEVRVDDGTGQAVLVFEDPSVFEYAKNLKKLRCFGKPFKEGEEQILSVQIVQDMENLNIDLLKKVMPCSQ